MSKFKKGDKVHRDLESWNGTIKRGEIYTVKEVHQVHISLEEVDGFWLSNKFEMCDESSFDIHKDTWFIRTKTPEEFKAAQRWAFEKGFFWSPNSETQADGTLIQHYLALGGNYTKTDMLGGSHPNFYITRDVLEIKVDFKTVVDKVEYPVKIDPKKAEIEELEKVVEDALQKIRNLKGE